MKDNKYTVEGEPQFTDIGKWFENFWYHYKAQTIIALVAVITLIICAVQFVNREESDYYVMYAGPQVLMLQDIRYIESAICEVGGDLDGNGKVAAALDDIVMLSPEEQEAAAAAGSVFDPGFLHTSMKEYEQQIFGGEAMVCLLSPYMYELVHAEGGFLPLSEIFEEIPDAAYDDCAVVLAKTDFGKHFNGINDLPEDTLICVRRLSTMAVFKGMKKSEATHAANVDLFRAMVEFAAPNE